MTRKDRFMNEWATTLSPSLLVVVIGLPSGALEVIQNSQNLGEKIRYYSEEYDEDLDLIRNSDVRIVDWIIA